MRYARNAETLVVKFVQHPVVHLGINNTIRDSSFLSGFVGDHRHKLPVSLASSTAFRKTSSFRRARLSAAGPNRLNTLATTAETTTEVKIVATLFMSGF
jgi:hypothetical protein